MRKEPSKSGTAARALRAAGAARPRHSAPARRGRRREASQVSRARRGPQVRPAQSRYPASGGAVAVWGQRHLLKSVGTASPDTGSPSLGWELELSPISTASPVHVPSVARGVGRSRPVSGWQDE